MTRKSVELRRGLLELLLKGDDQAVLASAGRLLAQTHTSQRQAGLDLLNGLIADKRQVEQVTALARSFAKGSESLTPAESVLLETIFAAGRTEETYTRENVLGLINPEQRTPIVPPRNLSVTIDTPAARACLRSLDALIEEQSTTPIQVKTWRGHEEMLLGNIKQPYYLPQPDLKLNAAEDEREHLPLAEVWLTWERERPASLRDEDGLELVRAALFLRRMFRSLPVKESEVASQEPFILRYYLLISWLLSWLRRRQEMSLVTLNFLLDTAEAALAHIDVAKLVTQETDSQRLASERHYTHYQFSWYGGLALLHEYSIWHGQKWEAEHVKRHWQLAQRHVECYG
ncbi:DUF5724 domain-containing protein [Dictyobacter kobayashii]|uniref:DUF5724 domain-containing protein n=1 Tax=Dictyobacter kobayashii TaxID=2014872 RepID=UPI000F8402ED|nr:hypothetical protein [Dictyobacter kobayashii]